MSRIARGNRAGSLPLSSRRIYTPDYGREERNGFHLHFEPRDQFEQRQKKLEQIQALGFEAFPREFRWTDTPADLVAKYSEVTRSAGVSVQRNSRGNAS